MTRPAPAGLGGCGLAALGASTLCFLVTALLGPSAFQPALPGAAAEPPYSLDTAPSPYLVTALVAAGIVLGAGGLGACMAAARRGWTVRPLPLVGAGLLAAVAFVFLPPVGSADHLNYASYGRMAATGHDPYATTAADVPHDPVIGAPEEWRTTPSVYGPITTAGQAFASWVGGDSVKLTVFALSALNVAAFALTAWILYKTSRTRARRLRTALLWTCNPLLLYQLVSGGHNDVLAIAPMVAALAVFSGRGWGRALAAGALTGAGAAIKLPAALVGGGPAWTLLRDRHARLRLLALFGGAGAAVAAGYALAGPHALDQINRASDMVSFATPWHLLDDAMGRGSNRDLIKIGMVLLALVLFALLVRALPRDGAAEHTRVSAAFVLAWLLAAPYALPWYDGFGWALLALLPWTRVDWVLLAHTTALSLAYLPARAPKLARMPDDLAWLFTTVRPTVVPWILLALLLALVLLCLRSGRSPATAAPPPASAASRG